MTLDTSWARDFASEWIDAWNAHDMERILSHYADDVVMYSPLIAQRLPDSGGTLRGKVSMRAYWAPSLTADPPLRFVLIDLLVGIDSITLYYENVGRRIVAETLIFDRNLRVVRGMSQWSVGPDGN